MPRAGKGFTLVEVLFAVAVVGIAMLSLIGFVGSTLKSTSNERDRAFAIQKSLQMMEEMASYKSTGPTDKGIDNFASGAQFALTTTAGAIPYQTLSGNPQVNGLYRFVRDIKVAPVTGDPYARQVTVEVFYADKSGAQVIPGGVGPLAVISNVLHTDAAAPGPVQVLDVYALSIENVPSMWRVDDSHQFYPSQADARRNFEASLRDITSMNQGLSFRIHYVTRMSVGRDMYYRPYLNETHPLDTTNGGSGTRDTLNYTYFYPGLIEQATGSPTYFDATTVAGNLSVDTVASSGSNGNYALADQFNHAVRYPEEFDASNNPLRPDIPSVVPAGTVVTGNPGVATTDSMSLRQFLEDLLTAPTYKYRNAILVNLNGEMFPALPLRNYSDAARDVTDSGTATRERRLVAHPWKLLTPATETVKLLVHEYTADGSVNSKTSGSGTNPPPYGAVENNLPEGSFATNGRIIIRGIRPYLDNMTIPGVAAAGDNDCDFEVRVRDIQREYVFKSGSFANAKFTTVTEWPSVASNLFVGGDNVVGRPYHSGPHGAYHTVTGNHDPTGVLSHNFNPNWSSGPNWTVPGGATAAPSGSAAGNDLVISLADLDYDCHQVTDTSGGGNVQYGISGSAASQHYGMEYFPDPFLPFLDVSNNTDYPRNTARMIIEFKLRDSGASSAVGKRFEVDTQLMRADGTYANPVVADPSTSKTYLYMGQTSDWNSTTDTYNPDAVPLTDQFQMTGDPRDVPYIDARTKGLYNPYWSNFVQGQQVYNHVTNPTSGGASNFAGPENVLIGASDTPVHFVSGNFDTSFPNTADSWEKIRYNAPDYFTLWRQALMRNNMIFVNPTGEPIRYLGMGGDFALQHSVNNYGDLKISTRPYDGGSGNAGAVADELIQGQAVSVEYNSGGNIWDAMPWLGELCPSSQFGTWTSTGNLVATGSAGYHRVTNPAGWDNFATNPSSANNMKLVSQDVGYASFLDAAIGSVPIDIGVSTGDAGAMNVTGEKQQTELRMTFKNPVKADFYYDFTGGTTPQEWSLAPYVDHTIGAWLDNFVTPSSYFDHNKSTDFMASPIKITDLPTPTTQMIALASTAKATVIADVLPLMDLSSALMVSSYFDGTQGTSPTAIKPVPRVKITAPVSGIPVTGVSVPLTWYAKFVRSDGTPFSPLYTYSSAAQSPIPVVFYVKYRSNSGSYCSAKLTGAVSSQCVSSVVDPTCDAGNIPTAAGVNYIVDTGYPNPNNETWQLVDPGGTALPDGDYVLRIEAFRKDSGGHLLPTNYSYHEIPITIGN